MQEYIFKRTDATTITVLASNEAEARRLAMITLWGVIPDLIVPHAPQYQGLGLYLNY